MPNFEAPRKLSNQCFLLRRGATLLSTRESLVGVDAVGERPKRDEEKADGCKWVWPLEGTLAQKQKRQPRATHFAALYRPYYNPD